MNATLAKFLTSRKFWLLVAATAALFSGHISEETWKWVAAGYLASQGYVDGKATGII